MESTGRLRNLLDAAARGTFPAEDASIAVLPPPAGPADAVVGFTAHHVVAAPVDVGDVRALLDPRDLGAPLRPAFLNWLGSRLGTEPGTLDIVLAAVGTAQHGRTDLRRLTDTGHPRVRRALRYRTRVDVYGDAAGRGVVVIGSGLDGRAEVSIEVDPAHRDRGLGAALARAARALVGDGEPIYAQVAAANASSLRSLLAAGYRPIGAEVLFLRRPARRSGVRTPSGPGGS